MKASVETITFEDEVVEFDHYRPLRFAITGEARRGWVGIRSVHVFREYAGPQFDITPVIDCDILEEIGRAWHNSQDWRKPPAKVVVEGIL